MVIFKMIDTLPLIEVGYSWSTITWICLLISSSHGRVERSHVATHSILFARFLLHSTQSLESDPSWCRLPLKIEHRMNWRYLDPPRSLFQCFPNQSWIISAGHYKLIAIFNISILKGYLWLLLLFSIQISYLPLLGWPNIPPQLCCIQLISHLRSLIIIHHLNKLWLRLLLQLILLIRTHRDYARQSLLR